MIDVSADVVKRAMASIGDRLARSETKGRITAGQRETIFARLTPRTDIADLADVQLTIEAVIEDMNIKQRVFASLEAATGPRQCPLVSNRSGLIASLSISDCEQTTSPSGIGNSTLNSYLEPWV